jgi:hypothetical protein
MAFLMGKEGKPISIKDIMKVSSKKAKSTEMESINGLMELNIKVILNTA